MYIDLCYLCSQVTPFIDSRWHTHILWNSIALTSNVVTELANTMKYMYGVLYNIIFHRVAIQKGFRWRHYVSQIYSLTN